MLSGVAQTSCFPRSAAFLVGAWEEPQTCKRCRPALPALRRPCSILIDYMTILIEINQILSFSTKAPGPHKSWGESGFAASACGKPLAFRAGSPLHPPARWLEGRAFQPTEWGSPVRAPSGKAKPFRTSGGRAALDATRRGHRQTRFASRVVRLYFVEVRNDDGHKARIYRK